MREMPVDGIIDSDTERGHPASSTGSIDHLHQRSRHKRLGDARHEVGRIGRRGYGLGDVRPTDRGGKDGSVANHEGDPIEGRLALC